jgi:hypothetical protein
MRRFIVVESRFNRYFGTAGHEYDDERKGVKFQIVLMSSWAIAFSLRQSCPLMCQTDRAVNNRDTEMPAFTRFERKASRVVNSLMSEYREHIRTSRRSEMMTRQHCPPKKLRILAIFILEMLRLSHHLLQ